MDLPARSSLYERHRGQLALQVAITQEEFDSLPKEEQAGCSIGYGVRFKTVPVSEEDRKFWRGMIEELTSKKG